MVGLVYSLLSYLGFLLSFSYFALFSAGVFVEKSVDSGLVPSSGSALLIDLGLILAFGLQHSLMARSGFKRWLTRFVPQSLERATYVLGSSLVLVLLMWQWRPIPTPLWNVQSPSAAALLWGCNALGWLGVPLSSLMIDHFDLVGVKRAFNGFRRVSFQQKGFVTPLFYRYVRHPMMTSLLVAFWLTPQMTIGHLLLSLGMTAYILIGVHFEERSLIEELGSAYVHYRKSTPKFLPLSGAAIAEASPATSKPAPRGSR
ncbi:MAG TPA: NnrU family protein [Polyangiaceae bacterium]|nr:NnrU family protein [Polyangiaceae bacterium]